MINIRIATPDDRDAIELLTRLLVSDRKETFDPKRFEWGLLRRLYDPLQRHGIFIAEEIETPDQTPQTKKIIGVIFSELRVDPFGKSEGYIKQFYVRPQYRKQGIGKRLLNTVVAHLTKMNIQIIKVNVKPGAEEAFRLYSEMDFTPRYTCLQLAMHNRKEKTECDDEEKIDLSET